MKMENMEHGYALYSSINALKEALAENSLAIITSQGVEHIMYEECTGLYTLLYKRIKSLNDKLEELE